MLLLLSQQHGLPIRLQYVCTSCPSLVTLASLQRARIAAQNHVLWYRQLVESSRWWLPSTVQRRLVQGLHQSRGVVWCSEASHLYNQRRFEAQRR